MFTAYQDRDGKIYSSASYKLTDDQVANLIRVLSNPLLLELFTEEELMIIRMAVKTHIVENVKSTIYQVNDSKKDEVIEKDVKGLLFSFLEEYKDSIMNDNSKGGRPL